MNPTPKPKPPYTVVTSFPDGTSSRRTMPNKEWLRQYLRRNATMVGRLGGSRSVTDATGRDVTREVL